MVNNFINFLMASKNLSFLWNFGSILFFIFFVQIFSGFFMVLGFINDSSMSFLSIQYVMYEMNYGWLLRLIHMNYVSFFFIIIFLHMFKGFFMNSFKMKEVWNIGLLIFIMLMVESFLGYVLIWSQMSFWACTVITSLLMIIPFIGVKLVFWIWSNYYICSLTLKFFFLAHFIVPLFMLMLIFMHFMFLHKYLSTSTIFIYNGLDKIMFFPFYMIKDFFFIFFFLFFFIFLLWNPFFFNDHEMFLESNHLVSPIHIVPEWYFLFVYDILRSIPNKFLGVFSMILSIFVFFCFSLKKYKNKMFILFFFLIYLFIFNCFLLSFLGSCFVESPFIEMGYNYTFFYFFWLLMLMNLFIFKMKFLI